MRYEGKKQKLKKRKKIIVYIFLILTIVFGFLSINEIYSVFKKEGEEKIIIIPEKSSVNRISKILKEEKIISSPVLFQIYSRFKDYKNIKDGKFKLNVNMKYDDIIKTITNQKNVIYDEKVNVFAGIDFFKLIEKYNGKFKISIEELVEEINKEENYKDFWFSKQLDKARLKKAYFPMEGFVLAYTYPIKENSTAKSLAKEILKKSNEKIFELKEKIEKSDMSLWDIFTLASIIQSETDDLDDMKRVSSVFHNRLKISKKLENELQIHKRLEADATTTYSKKIKKDIEEKNLKLDLDMIKNYDTYRIAGLPIGPICTPSIEAIDAAVNPANEDYYYFYADPKTGKILYEKSFERHKKNYIKNR